MRAADRELQGLSERMKQMNKFDAEKRKIKKEGTTTMTELKSQFSKANDGEYDVFKVETIGLVSAEDFRRRKQKMEESKGVRKAESHKRFPRQKRKTEPHPARTPLAKRKPSSCVGVAFDASEEEPAAEPSFAKKSLKNPDIDTSFLPDRDRDARTEEKRAALKKTFLEQQEQIKKERFSLPYLYWDGSGHTGSLTVRKEQSVRQLLEMAKESLSGSFLNLRDVAVENLMYVKNNLIIPSPLSFYELMAAGKRITGPQQPPLFKLVRFEAEPGDANEEAVPWRDEAAVGRIVTRSWYERNMHMVPASGWKNVDDDGEALEQ